MDRLEPATQMGPPTLAPALLDIKCLVVCASVCPIFGLYVVESLSFFTPFIFRLQRVFRAVWRKQLQRPGYLRQHRGILHLRLQLSLCWEWRHLPTYLLSPLFHFTTLSYLTCLTSPPLSRSLSLVLSLFFSSSSFSLSTSSNNFRHQLHRV